jgi:hypothetical protein
MRSDETKKEKSVEACLWRMRLGLTQGMAGWRCRDWGKRAGVWCVGVCKTSLRLVVGLTGSSHGLQLSAFGVR